MSSRALRVAVVAPPFFEIPPEGYGGIEVVVALLVDGLVDRGHDVTLIGAGRQRTKGRFLTTYDEPQPDRLGEPLVELTHAARVDALLRDLRPDVVHDHSAAGPLTARGRAEPMVVTSHGPATGRWGEYLSTIDQAVTLIAISESQRRLSPHLRWAGVVYNALDIGDIPLSRDKQDFVVWLGRMSPEKAPHIAIDVARAAGREIVLAAKCTEPAEHRYFEEFVRPRLGDDVRWHEQLTLREKYELFGSSAAFLFPIQWEEPFGMVMLEAMACGTPVLALDRGAAAEVVADGVTGFVRATPEELVDALDHLDRIDPADCRARVAEDFNAERMVSGYEQVYADAVAASAAPTDAAPDT